MKLTKSTLKQIIKEETQKVLNEVGVKFDDLDPNQHRLPREVGPYSARAGRSEQDRDQGRAGVERSTRCKPGTKLCCGKCLYPDECVVCERDALERAGAFPETHAAAATAKAKAAKEKVAGSTGCKPPKKLCCGKCLYPEKCPAKCRGGKPAMEKPADYSSAPAAAATAKKGATKAPAGNEDILGLDDPGMSPGKQRRAINAAFKRGDIDKGEWRKLRRKYHKRKKWAGALSKDPRANAIDQAEKLYRKGKRAEAKKAAKWWLKRNPKAGGNYGRIARQIISAPD